MTIPTKQVYRSHTDLQSTRKYAVIFYRRSLSSVKVTIIYLFSYGHAHRVLSMVCKLIDLQHYGVGDPRKWGP